jgi:adenylate kinase family enzyme
VLWEHSKIAVVGTSGSGKSTLARELARRLGHQHVELDALHWGPDWTERPNFVGRVATALEGERWVVCGNYGEVRDLVWQRATALIWLNYSFPRVFYRALRRTLKRVLTREKLYGDNRESLLRALSFDGIPWWVVRTYQRRKREYAALLRDARYSHLEVFELTRSEQADALLAAQR